MQHTTNTDTIHANRLQQLYKDRIIICYYIMYVRNSLKAKIFALHIAHFAVFVLKICIKTAQISFICCKRLKIQRFLAKCLVGCKYLCTFASQFRGIAQAKLLIDTIYRRGKNSRTVGGGRRKMLYIKPVG